MVDSVKEGSSKHGLDMNTKKTKTMVKRRNVKKEAKVNIKVDGVILEEVERSQYLGRPILDDDRCEKEI